jgi:hypothetical protein
MRPEMSTLSLSRMTLGLVRAYTLVVGLLAIGISCHPGTPDGADRLTPAPPPTVDPTVVTDREKYRAIVDAKFTKFVVGYRYTNPGPDTAFIPTCQGPFPPIVERWTGTEWAIVYNSPVPRCAHPPIVVPPGAAFTDTFEMMGARPGMKYMPTFDAPAVRGYYRLLVPVFAGPREPGNPFAEGGPVPPDRRRSNVFRVVD